MAFVVDGVGDDMTIVARDRVANHSTFEVSLVGTNGHDVGVRRAIEVHWRCGVDAAPVAA